MSGGRDVQVQPDGHGGHGVGDHVLAGDVELQRARAPGLCRTAWHELVNPAKLMSRAEMSDWAEKP